MAHLFPLYGATAEAPAGIVPRHAPKAVPMITTVAAMRILILLIAVSPRCVGWEMWMQMLRQEIHDGGVRLYVVVPAGETMAFVGEDQVLDLGMVGAGPRYDLVGFGFWHPGIPGALDDQQGSRDLMRVRDR